MTYKNFIIIKDISTTAPLWASDSDSTVGEDVYLLGTSFKINGGNFLSPKPKSFQNTTLTTADTDAGDDSTSYLNNYNRRKSNVSYSGFDNPTITVTCLYNNSKIGNTLSIDGSIRKIFNPSKIMDLVLKPRTVYLKDKTLFDLLSVSQDTSPAIYGTNGIPVLLKDWDISPGIDDEEIVINLTFIEDKGDTTKRV